MTATTATKTVTFKSGLLGTVVLNSYVDPFPGAKGTDTKPGTCPRCGGWGHYRFADRAVCIRCFHDYGPAGAGSLDLRDHDDRDPRDRGKLRFPGTDRTVRR